MKKIINIFIFVYMFLLNIFIGFSMKEPLIIFNIISLIFLLIYLIYSFIKKEKIYIIKRKTDIYVILFLLLPMLNLILHKYVSLNSEWTIILQNISLLALYILINNNCNKSKIINILIYSSLPVIIIAFSRLSNNIIWNYLLSKFDIFSTTYKTNRLVSNFNYPNTLAIYLSSLLFLILTQIKNNKKSIIYIIYSFILLLLIILTESRASIILLFIFYIIYLYIKRKDKNIKTIINISIINIIGILLYFILKLFLKNIYIILIVLLIFIIFLNYICKKYISKINIKYIINISIILILLSTIYITVGLNISKPINIINTKYYRLNIKNNKLYNIKIELDSNNIGRKDRFGVMINSVDNYGFTTTILNESFNTKDKVLNYKVYINKNTSYINIVFNNNYNNNLTIKKIYINNKEYILNYKLLPTNIVNKINNTLYNDKSMSERITMYKDSLKIFKKSIIFGNGYDSWRYMYNIYKSYNYTVNVMHSSIFDILINYGLLGISILSLLIYKTIKSINNKNIDINILFSLLILFTHSIIDFDMSFMLIKYYSFILLILLLNDINDKKYENKYINYIAFLITITFIIFNINYLYVNKYVDKVNEMNYEKKYKEYIKLSKICPFNLKNNYYKLFYESNTVLNDLTIINIEEKDLVKDLNNFIKNEPYFEKNDVLRIYTNLINVDLEKENINKTNITNFRKKLNYNDYKYDLDGILDKTNILINLYDNYNKYYIKTKDTFIKEEMKYLHKYINKNYTTFTKNLNSYQESGINELDYKEFLNNYEEKISEFNNTYRI